MRPTCPTCLQPLPTTPGVVSSPTTPGVSPTDLRRLRRVVEAVRLWRLAIPAKISQDTAFAAVGWKLGGAWCAAWAGLVDLNANGGPGRGYNPGYSVSCTRRVQWAHTGSGRDRQGNEARPALGSEYAPRPPRSVQPGDIITVGPRKGGQWQKPNGQHCTIAIHVDEAGVVAIGGNQSGLLASGRRAAEAVVATRYGFDGRGLLVQHVVSIPDSEYPAAGPVDAAAVADAVAAVRAVVS